MLLILNVNFCILFSLFIYFASNCISLRPSSYLLLIYFNIFVFFSPDVQAEIVAPEQ